MGMRVFLLLLALPFASANGRIGETAIQFADRYGAPKDTQLTKIVDKSSPLVEGAIHHTYEYQGWKIRAAFLQLDGLCVRMDYAKFGPDIVIKDYEIQAIASANSPPGMRWTKIMYDNPNSPNQGMAKVVEGLLGDATGQKMWRRTDGATLWLRSSMTVRLELPIARQHEAQLKIRRDQQARARVPTF
jgi:hypothetical protein